MQPKASVQFALTLFLSPRSYSHPQMGTNFNICYQTSEGERKNKERRKEKCCKKQNGGNANSSPWQVLAVKRASLEDLGSSTLGPR